MKVYHIYHWGSRVVYWTKNFFVLHAHSILKQRFSNHFEEYPQPHKPECIY